MRRALILPLCLACVPAAEARDYGQQGAVFPVIERDLLEQIHTRLTAMEKSGETGRLNQELQRRTTARVNRPEPVDGLVLSSPAFDTGMTRFQRALTRLLYRWAPNLTLPNGLDANAISHDPAVVQAYQNDRLVHNRISARLAHFIDSNGPRVVAAAPSWAVPTLLMYAGADLLVRPEGSRAFAAVAPPQWVSSRRLDGQFHEIFNETDPSTAYATLSAWLDHQAPA